MIQIKCSNFLKALASRPRELDRDIVGEGSFLRRLGFLGLGRFILPKAITLSKACEMLVDNMAPKWDYDVYADYDENDFTSPTSNGNNSTLVIAFWSPDKTKYDPHQVFKFPQLLASRLS